MSQTVMTGVPDSTVVLSCGEAGEREARSQQ